MDIRNLCENWWKIYLENHPFQYLTALTFFIAGLSLSAIEKLPRFLRWFFWGLGVIAACDEIMMIHECAKISIFLGLHSSHLRDISVAIYSSLAVLGGVVGWRYLKFQLKDWHLLLFGFCSLLAVVGHDVLGIGNSTLSMIAEEVGEFTLALSAIMIVYINKWGKKLKRKDVFKKLFFGIILATVLIIIFISIRPDRCQDLYDRFHL